MGDKVVKAEGLAVSVPLLLWALPETPGWPEVSRPEVQWEVQWGHPVVRFQGLP